MAQIGFFHKLWLTRFSKPAGDRVLYRHVLKNTPRRIIEMGIGTLGRAERLLGLVNSLQADGGLHYVGLDRFEARLPSDVPGVSLKQAHQRLHSLARVQLVPGNIDSSLSRLCNHLGVFDLVLISADNDERHLERSWFFIQRIINAQSTILFETRATGTSCREWKVVDKPQIDRLASQTLLKRAG